MNSKGWKLSLFAIAAVIGLSACGERKKTKATSPLAGVWIEQENMRLYSRNASLVANGDYRGFCPDVYRQWQRFATSSYRVRVISVTASGEVFRYAPGDNALALGFRESNYLATVNATGTFTAGAIGPDGRINSGYGYASDNEELPAQGSMMLMPQNRNVLRLTGGGDFVIMERHSRAIADEYVFAVNVCMKRLKQAHQERGVVIAGGGPGPLPGAIGPGQMPGPGPGQMPPGGPAIEPKDYDPTIPPQVQPMPRQPRGPQW